MVVSRLNFAHSALIDENNPLLLQVLRNFLLVEVKLQECEDSGKVQMAN